MHGLLIPACEDPEMPMWVLKFDPIGVDVASEVGRLPAEPTESIDNPEKVRSFLVHIVGYFDDLTDSCSVSCLPSVDPELQPLTTPGVPSGIAEADYPTPGTVALISSKVLLGPD
eukprot:CAMPEP_0184298142 /NCGR_PEP_ID=MMETSP1049-20130417/9000_1 /TAXON_ID=77928 /ORGANISM="Proteomonas sulcata, Strain CCMP704" /LENGTH=114 /DNA_ID=CAMNT_0026608183 /DNA_START=262 /DNA_END=607 /DNA_ORIENTATION=-